VPKPDYPARSFVLACLAVASTGVAALLFPVASSAALFPRSVYVEKFGYAA
jgi:hypothetical protein